MNKYMEIAIIEAQKAYKKDDIPVGAVIVKNGKIIAKAYNKKENKGISTYHAEILAINKACKKLHNWRLNDCELYVTMEPCMMCCGAIIQSRISRVVYGVGNNNYGHADILKQNSIEVVSGIMEEKCLNIVQDFFAKKRGKTFNL